MPTDGLPHDIVFTGTSASGGNVNSLFGRWDTLTNGNNIVTDFTVTSSGTTYHWPMDDEAQTLTEANFGTNNFTIGSVYTQDRWF